jgi:hypothetical protein
MKTNFSMLAIIFFMFFVSCDSSSIDETEFLSVQAKTAVERNISNTFEGTDTPTGSIGGGIMTHLGRFQAVQTATLLQNNGDGTFNYASNDIITAANGDMLFSQSTVLLTFSSALEATYVGGFTITGGTGRFVGATGYLSFTNGVYIINGDTGIGTSRHNAFGMITY